MSAEDIAKTDDVKLEVCHMNNLPGEVRRRFTSDMGFAADFLNEGGFESRREQKILHGEALCRMMTALTGDTRFADLTAEISERHREGKEIAMCEYIDMLEARGEARGVIKVLCSLVNDGLLKAEEAARRAHLSKEDFGAEMKKTGYENASE